jgi:hypothetical protein
LLDSALKAIFEKESTKMGRNYHRADWDKFRSLVYTSKMAFIANRRRWTPLLIKAATDRWYSGVNMAFNLVCKPSKVKTKDVADWVKEDCESAKRKYRIKEKQAYRRGRPSPADLTALRALNRSLKNCIKSAKKEVSRVCEGGGNPSRHGKAVKNTQIFFFNAFILWNNEAVVQYT